MTTTRRRITVALLALCCATGLAACGDEANNVSTDEIGVKYSGGSIEGKKFTEIREPGSTDYWNSNDPIYKMPLTQRSYTIRNDADKDKGNDPDVNGFVNVPALDTESGISTLLNYELALTFKLNTNTQDIKGFDGGTLRRFFEQICRSYKCWIDGEGNLSPGWRKMLREKLFAALEAAFKDNARKYPPDNQVNNTLVDDPEDKSKKAPTLDLLQRDTARSFGTYLTRLTGGNYFCGPSFVRNREDNVCPAVVMQITSADYANPKLRAGREEKKYASDVVAAATTLRESLKDKGYREYLWIQAANRCAEVGKAVCVFSPNGGSTPIPAGR